MADAPLCPDEVVSGFFGWGPCFETAVENVADVGFAGEGRGEFCDGLNDVDVVRDVGEEAKGDATNSGGVSVLVFSLNLRE